MLYAPQGSDMETLAIVTMGKHNIAGQFICQEN